MRSTNIGVEFECCYFNFNLSCILVISQEFVSANLSISHTIVCTCIILYFRNDFYFCIRLVNPQIPWVYTIVIYNVFMDLNLCWDLYSIPSIIMLLKLSDKFYII